MVYLFIKEVAESTDSGDIIIVVQSLVKDMVNDVPALYKGNAIRVLSKIVDAGMLGQVERYYKQAIVDRDEFVSSAALVSSLLLARQKPGCADSIVRWSNEVLTVLNTSRADMAQFHALALLKTVKKNDKLAVSKLVQTLMSSGMRSPLGLCLLIRYVNSMLLSSSDTPAATVQQSYSFIESCLQHKSDVVVYEAARALTNPPGGAEALLGSGRDVGPAVNVLQTMLSSTKPGQRYAGVRTLSRLASSHPQAVSKCNDELEGLILDSNRVIGTLAITALLKTGNEQSADRLIKQITSFMVDVGSDELKVIVVRAVHELCLRVPSKHRSIMAFLSNLLRDEGDYDFKKSILDALLDIMENIPEAKTECLFHCCEFIEDCEYTALATRVLHLLGKEGPALAAPQPSQFIRFIYNRVILENAAVRASAVSALAKFATQCDDLRPQIIPLLQSCTDDDDDEVRDRAALYLSMLGAPILLAVKGQQQNAGVSGSSKTSTGGGPSVDLHKILNGNGPIVLDQEELNPVDASVSKALTSGTLPMPVAALTKALKLYQARPAAGPFAFAALPHVDVPTSAAASAAAAAIGGFGYSSEVRAPEDLAIAGKAALARSAAPSQTNATGSTTSSGGSAASATSSTASTGGSENSGLDAAAEALYKINEFSTFGPLFRSSRLVELTEKELEYLVSVRKHVFASHLVLEFTITNTVPDILLERVVARLVPSDPSAYRLVTSLSCPRVREGQPGICYAAFQRNPAAGFSAVSFSCELRFNVRECDPAKNYEPVGDPSPEDYPVNDVEVSTADFVAKVPVADFRSAWEAMGAEGEVLESFTLAFKTVGEAVSAIIDTIGLAPCEGSGQVKAGTNKHQALLAGVFLGDVKVFARLQVTLDASSGCVLKISIRAPEKELSEMLMSCIS
jgi:coatomer subunit gamma